MSSSGYSNAQQHFIGSHRGGGFQPLMQQGPNPTKAQRPQSMSPAQQAAPPVCRNSDGQQPQAHELVTRATLDEIAGAATPSLNWRPPVDPAGSVNPCLGGDDVRAGLDVGAQPDAVD